ncbi:MAG TPA: carboxymuconolactone decarboxylase family protein [Bryobacteraceae bacterium]|nr:carboxymuconolactone decarboxylase family protein [Bryobacteraceae bacterium]
MEIAQFLELIPEYAKDLKLNLTSGLRQPELTERQTWGTAVACAVAARNPQVLEAVLGEAVGRLDAAALSAAKSAAALMGMNNVFYRFRHLSSNEKYGAIPARLRMQAIRTHGSDPVDFELWCLAVSAINGCGVCVDSHERVLREKGVTEETILAAVRIASAIHGLAAVMDAEAVEVGTPA